MMVSDEEKRWLVVGIAMNKVAAPVLRDFIKQGLDTQYTNNTYCHGLTTPCTMATLTYHHVNADPNLKRLKFQNINSNLHNHGNHRNLYNYNINSSVDLAKLFLPDYLAEFSAFDESLDMSAMLRLLGFNNPAPIFLSPNPLISIQTSADDVRENVRNKWGHCNVTQWTEVLFNDCFSKLETLVRSLGLTGGMEKMALDQLSDWQTKGCQLCMGHAVDKDLLSLVQKEVKGIIKDLTLHDARLDAVEEKLREDEEARREETENIMRRLVSIEKILNEDLLRRVQGVEEGLAAANVKVEELGQGLAKTDENVLHGLGQIDNKVERLDQGLAKTDENVVQGLAEIDNKVGRLGQDLAKTDENVVQGLAEIDNKVERLGLGLAKTDENVEKVVHGLAETDDKVEQLGQGLERLEHEVKSHKIKPGSSTASGSTKFSRLQKWLSRPFTKRKKADDIKTCRSKLAEHYKRTATVPTSVWSKKSPVDIHQIYTRLSWVKEEQTPAGSSQSKLRHYTDLFAANKNGVVPKRILVQGQTGIGKSTFVKKLAVDWAELDDVREAEEQKDVLKQFELLVVVNLKEVSKYQSLKDVFSRSSIFPREERHLTDSLLDYITNNQENVLLVFDGYDEYRCGRNSEIYEIFKGRKLRNCCVLITSRISKADELREFNDVHAEITGFSAQDREAFMKRMLGGEKEAEELRRHLSQQRLTDLTRVPLLLVFFCTLWKKGKLKSFPETKTKLYLLIVQYVLDYNQGKDSPAYFNKVDDFKEILTEIGKVALECLLKDDHVFEYDQLSAAILCEESRIIGLLQVTEYAENLRPAGMVSFIHKSIQEFLAAWYITYRCVPEGNLGGIEQHARTLEDCKALENVFQFICGLSDDGAVKVFQHFTSVRISDPTLDLSKIIPGVESETDVPLCDVTYRHWRFSDLVNFCLREVQSKAELERHWLDCTAGVMLIDSDDRRFSEQIQNMKHINRVDFSVVFRENILRFSLGAERLANLYESLERLDCLRIPMRITKESEVLLTGDFFRTFKTVSCIDCHIDCILRFHNGQTQFYITGLFLCCARDDHARLFTESADIPVPSSASNVYLNESCLKFLTSLKWRTIVNAQTFKFLGAVIRNCRHLKSIEFLEYKDGLCELLEEVTNPRTCSLSVGDEFSWNCCSLSSAGVERLAGLLPRFNSITSLVLQLRDCCAKAVNKLLSSITHNTLKVLVLMDISLTPAAAAALGRSLPEMSSLRTLLLTGVNGSILQVEGMEALFGGLNKTFLALTWLNLSYFNARGSLAPLTERMHFFSNLDWLSLNYLNMDEHDLHGLLESLRSYAKLRELWLCGNPLGDKDRVESIVEQALPQVHLWY